MIPAIVALSSNLLSRRSQSPPGFTEPPAVPWQLLRVASYSRLSFASSFQVPHHGGPLPVPPVASTPTASQPWPLPVTPEPPSLLWSFSQSCAICSSVPTDGTDSTWMTEEINSQKSVFQGFPFVKPFLNHPFVRVPTPPWWLLSSAFAFLNMLIP